MEIIKNLPAISILICMFAAIISSGLKKKAARNLSFIVIILVGIMSLISLVYVTNLGQSIVYVMGKFPAPWGNEIRFGTLECMMAFFFSVIMFLSLLGGISKIETEIAEDKQFLYYVLIDLLFSSLLALIYTNDIFTAYVFVEINTIAAAGLIIIRNTGRTIEAGVRYMVMSLLGSGLLLSGIMITYDITGHLLMSNIKEAIAMHAQNGEYVVPLTVGIAIMVTGLCIKSALFPFHNWLPDAYGYSTISSSAILSSLVSKGYIFLVIKIFYRVVGIDIVSKSHVLNILFVFGLIAMVAGSVSAIRENDIRRMIAFSSVAQIGYIYMGFGMGVESGMVASIFHILSHAATKSMLFIAAIGLTDVSGQSRKFKDLTGSAQRNKIAGLGFLVGSLSMVGIPLFSGFISKLLFMDAAFDDRFDMMLPALIVLGISTILNAVYFMRTAVRIYVPVSEEAMTENMKKPILRPTKLYAVVTVLFIILNVFLGLGSNLVLRLINMGLEMFS